MSTTSPYIQYLNKLTKPTSQITSLQQLSDGLLFHDIVSNLKQFEPVYSYEIITEPVTFIHRMKNIKSLIKAIHDFWTNHLHQEVCYQIDAIRISKDKSMKEIQKLIRLLVKTLFQSKNKLYFIQTVLQTSQQTQEFFMDLVTEQTSVEFTSPKSSKSRKNYNDSLYDKLLELQHENQHLLKVMEDLATECYERGQKERDLEEKLNERETEIKRLNWMLNEVNEKKFKGEDYDLTVSREKSVDQSVFEKVRELEEREKVLLTELQNCKILISSQSEDLKELSQLQRDNQSQKQQIFSLKQQNSHLSIQLSQSAYKLQTLQIQLQSHIQQTHTQSTLISSLQQTITSLQQQLTSSQEQIELLETNVRYLTEEKDDFSSFRQMGSSIKDECKGQSHLVRKKRETTQVNKDLRSALLTISKQEKEIEKLKVYEEENKKLVQMISHMHKYRGEQNQVLVHCLYKLRMQLLQKEQKIISKDNKSGQHSYVKPQRSPLGEADINY